MADPENIPPEFLPPEPFPKKGPFHGLLRAVIAVVVLFAILFFFGLRELTRFHTTSPDIDQPVISNQVPDQEMLTVPLTVFVVSGEETTGSDLTSDRTGDEVRRLVENASNIWNQAGITLVPDHVFALGLDEYSRGLFEDDIRMFIKELPQYDSETINVFLTKHLDGINGVAYMGARTIAVADLTTTFDFRVLAHEVGHALGLMHRSDSSALMSPTAAGDSLSSEEIKRSRENVLNELFGAQ